MATPALEAPKIINVKQEDAEDGDSPPIIANGSPSFKGKLNISSYGFSPKREVKTEVKTESESSATLHLVEPKAEPKVEPLESQSAPRSNGRPKRKARGLSSPPNKRRSSSYAPPSTYAHLPELRDTLIPNLICVFIGLNPGITTAASGHAYAHPSNLFWRLLHSSGCTPRRCTPQEDGDLPELFALGNTNIVSRPTRNGGELSNTEMDDSVHILEEKIGRFRPEAVCIVGKSIWESIWRVRHNNRKIKKEEFKYGWQDEAENMGVVDEWKGAKVFVATTTSGLAATMSLQEKERIWRELGTWVERRRAERAASAGEAAGTDEAGTDEAAGTDEVKEEGADE